jgi:hypothetical protein
VQKASELVMKNMGTSSGRDKLVKDFNLCAPMEGGILDYGTFESSVAGAFMGTVQYNMEIPNAPTVKDLCDEMNNSSDPYSSLVQLVNEAYGSQQECLDVSYKSSLVAMKNTTFDGSSSMRQWVWQTCNEFGYYQSASSADEPFSSFVHLSLDYYLQQCKDVYESESLPPVDFVTDMYGGLDLAGTRIVLPNGSLDPWSSLGITTNDTKGHPQLHPVLIDGTAHCADMNPISPKDLPQMTIAKNEIMLLVSGMLAN